MIDEHTYKKRLINYIKVNATNFTKEYLNKCTLTTLTIIKTEIEISIYNNQDNNRNNPKNGTIYSSK